MKNIIVKIFLHLLIIKLLFAANITITLLPDNNALIQEKKLFSLKKGTQRIFIKSFPAGINIESLFIWPLEDDIILKSLGSSDPLISKNELLSRNINNHITITLPNGQKIKGRLIEWFDNGSILYLKTDNNNTMYLKLNSSYFLNFDEDTTNIKPNDFYPHYFIEVESKKDKKAYFDFSYSVEGFNWGVDYLGTLNSQENKMLLSGWLNVENDCGKNYQNAKINLLIGEPELISYYSLWEKSYIYKHAYFLAPSQNFNDLNFNEKNLTDFKILTLKNKVNLNHGDLKKIPLINPRTVNVEKKYVFTIDEEAEYIESQLIIKNSSDNELGFTLPGGVFHIFKEQKNQRIFISNTEIDNVPVNGQISFSLGKVFDIKGEIEVIKIEDVGKDTIRTTYELRIKNYKKTPVTIEVIDEYFEGYPLKVEKFSLNNFTLSNAKLKFKIRIPAESEKLIQYTILESTEL